MQTYTEYRLIVKDTKRKRAVHVGNVADPVKWVQGKGLAWWLSEDKDYFAPVDWIKIVRYDGVVGLPAKRGETLVYVKNGG